MNQKDNTTKFFFAMTFLFGLSALFMCFVDKGGAYFFMLLMITFFVGAALSDCELLIDYGEY